MAGANVKTFTADNWQNDVLGSSKLVLVDFWATWCGPCRMIAPVIEELADDYVDKVTIGKLNVDEQGVIAEKYGVMSIPTLLLFKNGQIVEKIVGFRGKPDIAKLLDAKM
jgi:thioredoxin 1